MAFLHGTNTRFLGHLGNQVTFCEGASPNYCRFQGGNRKGAEVTQTMQVHCELSRGHSHTIVVFHFLYSVLQVGCPGEKLNTKCSNH